MAILAALILVALSFAAFAPVQADDAAPPSGEVAAGTPTVGTPTTEAPTTDRAVTEAPEGDAPDGDALGGDTPEPDGAAVDTPVPDDAPAGDGPEAGDDDQAPAVEPQALVAMSVAEDGTGTVAGVVRDSAGRPIQSHRVEFQGNGDDWNYFYGDTDASGAYFVDGVDAGTYEYSLAGEVLGTVEVAGGEAVTLGITVSTAYGSLSGTVTDANGDPVGPFLLNLYEEETGSGSQADVDASGSFSLASLRSGDYDWQVYYGPQPPVLAEGTVVVDAGTAATLDIELPVVFGSVSGTIKDVDGQLVNGGRVDLEGIDVDTVQPGDEVRYAEAWLTDGAIDIDNVLPGTYRVTYSDEYGEGPEGFVDTTIEVASGAVTPVDLALQPNGYIEGTVTDSAGNPVVGIDGFEVYASGMAEEDWDLGGVAELDDNGYYRISLPPSTYTVTTSTYGTWGDPEVDLASSYQDNVVVVSGQGTTVDFTVYDQARISGKADGLWEGSGALPEAVDPETGEWVRNAWADADEWDEDGWATGSYVISNLLPGSYAVSFGRASGYSTISEQFYGGSRDLAGAEVLTLAEGEHVTGIDPSLAAGTLTGHIEDVEGNALRASQVVAFTDDDSLFARSGMGHDDGSFAVAGLAEGDYLVSVWFRSDWVYDEETDEYVEAPVPDGVAEGEYFYAGPGMLSRDRADAVPVTSSVPGSLDLDTLVVGATVPDDGDDEGTGTIAGTVLAGPDLTTEGVWIDGLDSGFHQLVTLDGEGGFSFGVPAGSYRVQLEGEGDLPEPQDVVVEEGQTVTVTIAVHGTPAGTSVYTLDDDGVTLRTPTGLGYEFPWHPAWKYVLTDGAQLTYATGNENSDADPFVDPLVNGLAPGDYTLTLITDGGNVVDTDTFTIDAVDEPGDGGPGDGEPGIPSADELTDANKGSVTGPGTGSNETPMVLHIGTEHAGDDVDLWFFSPTVYGASSTVDTDGDATVIVPMQYGPGDYKVAAYTLDGDLIGWHAFTILAVDDPGDGEPGDGEPGDGEPGDNEPGDNEDPITEADLVAENKGSLTGPSNSQAGQQMTLDAGEEFAGQEFEVLFFSDPISGGMVTVAPDGTATVTVPAALPAGDHRVALVGTGGVIGWHAFTVVGGGGTPGAGDAGAGDAGAGDAGAGDAGAGDAGAGDAGAGDQSSALPATGGPNPLPIGAGVILVGVGLALLRRGARVEVQA
ncbi:carboxypeptidase regulatory-like domain-containing protein [Nocardioides sp. AE5]|uniref:carboxypeptidase regulatory-like domain-containing protein n=1 Tax=Nocardioides sp. AE5 TaxID=2962573 RepID=UPI0028817CD7|nr:carboxypeptidase regulatory-like domain-containing protein [Nocardioides sp. AE5]MDT0200389.1 carboxypeptidase regulatory-like domain-containing protein [Nocardioides sp. AE5]